MAAADLAVSRFPRCSPSEAGPGCGQPMRPRGYTRDMAPGTVATGHNRMCKSCVKPDEDEAVPRTVRSVSRKPELEVRVEHAVKGLEAYYARRYARGVAPEAAPVIRWTGTGADVIQLRPAAAQDGPAALQAA